MHVSANERFVRRARRLAREAVTRIGDEVHQARLALGLSQEEVGRIVGMSRSKVGRIERAEYGSAPLADLVRVAAVVGLELSVRAYPVGAPYRDRAHAALLDRLRRRVHPDLGWRTEVPFPDVSDLRAWDALITGRDFRDGVEAETRVRDGQALERRVAQKLRDGAAQHVILLLSDTRANRSFVRDRRGSLAAAFPVASATPLRALAEGRDPGGSALIVL